jgi:E3 ubiquitin-protein ligase RHA2
MNLNTFAITIIFLPCLFLLVIISEALARLATRVMQMHARSHFDWPRESLFNGRDHVSPLFQQCKQQLCIKRYKCGTSQQRDPVQCMFCLTDMSDGEEMRELRCQHIFHRACLDEWLEHRWATCPICRDCLLAHVDGDEMDETRLALISYFDENWWML